jgi:tRNA splicing ligase
LEIGDLKLEMPKGMKKQIFQLFTTEMEITINDRKENKVEGKNEIEDNIYFMVTNVSIRFYLTAFNA